MPQPRVFLQERELIQAPNPQYRDLKSQALLTTHYSLNPFRIRRYKKGGGGLRLLSQPLTSRASGGLPIHGGWVLQRWVFRSLFLSCPITLPFEPLSSFYSLLT